MAAVTLREAALRTKVVRSVDELAGRMVETLGEAIRIRSVNPKYPGQRYEELVGGEADMSALMADLYREAGADVETVTVEHGRDNACGRICGAGSGRSLLFNGHVDVVPPGDEAKWASASPFEGLVTDERVIGRGATDMKSGLIAHAFAAIALKRTGVRLLGDVVLQSVVGEEVGDHLAGTTACLEAGYGADAAIVCEPTGGVGLSPALAPVQAGLLWFSIQLEGKAAHSGLRGLTIQPTLEGHRVGVNTIDKFWIVYHALRQLEDEWAACARHSLFRPGAFGILPGVVTGHPEGMLVPFSHADTLTAEYALQHHPGRTSESVVDEIEQTVLNACRADPWLREHPPVFDWKLVWPSAELDADSPLLPVLAEAHEAAFAGTSLAGSSRQEGFFGVTDLNWINAKGIAGLSYGPGVAFTAHAEDEYVEIGQLIGSAKAYALAAMSWCGVDAGSGEPGPP